MGASSRCSLMDGASVTLEDKSSIGERSSGDFIGDFTDDSSNHYSGHTDSSYLYTTSPWLDDLFKFQEAIGKAASMKYELETIVNSNRKLVEELKHVQKACEELLWKLKKVSKRGESEELLNEHTSIQNNRFMVDIPREFSDSRKSENVNGEAEMRNLKDAHAEVKYTGDSGLRVNNLHAEIERVLDLIKKALYSKSSTGEEPAFGNPSFATQYTRQEGGCKNQPDNVPGLEDIVAKQLSSLHGVKSEQRLVSQRAEMCKNIVQKNSILKMRARKIDEEKQRILRYTPGNWLFETGGMTRCDYDIPSVTSLLLVGLKGAGKSTLINSILRVLSSGHRINRAQVSYKSSPESGTYFLQEYSVPESKSFCIYDSRGLSGNVTEDCHLLQNWIIDGIRHGEIVLRSSEDISLRTAFGNKERTEWHKLSKIRKVHFVIFVVNALSIVQLMTAMDTQSLDILVKLFSFPHLSFKDDKPVIVMTHGDALNASNRLKARIFLGELLGVSAADQVFDVSDECNLATDVAVLDMLEYALQRADNNLQCKKRDCVPGLNHVFKALIMMLKWHLKLLKKTNYAMLLMLCLVLITISAFIWNNWKNGIQQNGIGKAISSLWHG